MKTMKTMKTENLLHFIELCGIADYPEKVAGLKDSIGPGIDELALASLHGNHHAEVVVAQIGLEQRPPDDGRIRSEE